MVSTSRLASSICCIYIVLISPVNAKDSNRCVSIVDDVKRLSCYDSLFIDQSIEPKVIELDTIKKPVETLKKTESELEDATIKAAQDAYNQVIEDAKAMVVAKVTEGRNKKVYYYMNNDRIFRKNTSRSATFRVDDIVELEGGALGAQFLINQNGKRIKVKEISSK